MQEQQLAEENLILKVLTGSHLYGTDTVNSDKDYVGIFIPPKDYMLGLKTCEQVESRTNSTGSGRRNTKDDTDMTIYSLPKFIKLAIQNNPNIVEIFFAPESNIVYCNEFGRKLLDSYQLFISKKVKHTFLGYAHAQKEKLFTKKDRLDALHKTLDFIVDVQVNSVSGLLEQPLQVKGKYGVYKTYEKGTQLNFIENDLITLLDEYGLRTKMIQEHGYDLKFASHLIRLLSESIEFLETGKLTLPLREVSLIRDIKEGLCDLQYVKELTEHYEKLIEDVDCKSQLQHIPQFDKINTLQISLIENYWEYTR
jgi:uncharacterized protein